MPNSLVRPRLSASDVSQDEQGLRQLASTGSWLAALQLAERLEQRCCADTGGKGPNDQSLRFALVRVTAYLKMNQPDAAKRALDALGENILDPSTNALGSTGKKILVPFSLHFLNAVVPGLLGQGAVSQSKLYDLLSFCDVNQAKSLVDRLLWKSRAKRVTRALIANHLELAEYSVAISLLTDLAESETDEIRHYWYQQQLGCLCLRSGNVFLALEVFKSIENTSVDDEDDDGSASRTAEAKYDAKEFKRLICAVNKGLVLAFRGEYAEAQTVFRSIAGEEPAASSPPLAALLRACCLASAEGCCAAYVATPKTDDNLSATSVQQIVAHLEGAIVRNPKTLLSMDVALVSLSRLYLLEGEHGAAKVATLANIVELFRCGREALPKYLK